jgi:hypothetical protein
VPVKWIHGSRANSDQDFVVPGGGLVNLVKLEDVGRAVVEIDDRFPVE